MKRVIKTVKKALALKTAIVTMFTVLVLSGCASEEAPGESGVNLATIPGMQKVEGQETTMQTRETVPTEAVVKQESDTSAELGGKQESHSKENVTSDFDVEAMLQEAEEQEAILWKKYEEIASPTQMDMNINSGEIYKVWDDALNELWQVLKKELDEKTMAELLKEQRSWIKDKEAALQQIAEEIGGGSITPLVCNSEATDRTKRRVYELAAYLGYETIAYYVEGVEERVPATIFEGRLYTLLIPDEGWEMSSSEFWMSVDNPAVQFWVTDYAGDNADVISERLMETGEYVAVDDDKYLLCSSAEGDKIHYIKLFTEDGETIGVFYCYPVEAKEGFGSRLSAIVNSFQWVKR